MSVRKGVLAFVCSLVLIPAISWADASVVSASGAPRARTANGQWIALTAGVAIPAGSTIVTGPTDRLVVKVNGQTQSVASNSTIPAARLGGADSSMGAGLVAGRAQGSVSTSISGVAGVRAERSDSHDPFRHFRRPGQTAAAAATNPQERFNEAQRYFNLGDFRSARSLADDVEGDPALTAKAEFLKGLASYNLFEFTDAAASFESALAGGSLDSTQGEQALLFLGLSRFNLGQSAASNEALYKLLELYPQGALRVSAMYQIALNLVDLGDKPKAIEAFNYIIREYPNDQLAEAARQDLARVSR